MPRLASPVGVAVSSLRAVLANPALRRLEAAYAAGIAGDAALLVALIVAAYAAGGPAFVGLLAVARMLPATATGLIAARPVARFRAERLLVAIPLIRAAVAALVGAVLLLGLPIWPAFLAAGVASAFGALVRPVQSSLFPGLARTSAELLAANVVASAGEGVGTLVGPVAAGLGVAAAGPMLGSAVACVLFLVGAVAMLAVTLPAGGAAMRVGTSREPVASGIAIVAAHRATAVVLGAFLAQVFVRGLLLTLVVVASVDLLGSGEAGVGWLNAAFGLGGLLGGLAALGLVTRRDLPRMFAVSLSAWGLPIALIAASPVLVVGLAAMAASGIANALLDVSGFTILQRSVSPRERAAVFGLLEACSGIGVAAGSVVASVLLAAVGPRGALAIAGSILPIVAVATWPVISSLERAGAGRDEAIALLHRVRLFEPLALDALDRIACAMTPVAVAAGVELMREGEPGDRYLVIADGWVDVVRGGQLIARTGPGEGVGEIALLRSVPRTATVVASTPVAAFAIDPGTFRAAIVGPAAAVADRLVSDRLPEPVTVPPAETTAGEGALPS